MPRFVLIDQSIQHGGGHHYEYAARVLRAARAEGFSPVLATNRRYEPGPHDEWEVHPVYRYGFWEKPLQAPKWKLLTWRPMAPGWWTRLKLRVIYSPLGLAAQYIKEGRNPIAAVMQARFSPVMLLLGVLVGLPLLLPILIVRAVLKLVWSLMPGKDFVKRAGRALAKLLLLPVWPVWWAFRERRPLVFAARQPLKRRAFGEDTLRLIKELHPTANDVIFIPTLSELEMLGLLGAFDRSEESRRPTWHLLFRRNIYVGRDPTYPSQDEGLRSTRNMFREFVEGLAGQRVRFYTDTDELTAQYDRLGVVRFKTLPIPVDEGYHMAAAARDPREQLRIVYAGDAREEKGFQYIPGLAKDLWSSHVEAGRARFVLQAYYNNEPGEPACRVARAQLEGMPSPQVTLVKRSLGGEAYRDFVCDGDILLIAYDRDNYYARSSGIFTEAAAAGIPTIIPTGTWMSLQLEKAVHEHHRQVLRSSTVHRHHEGAKLRWYIQGAGQVRRLASGRVTVSGSRPRWTIVDVPGGSTHVMVTLHARMDLGRDFMSIAIEQLDKDGHQIDWTQLISGEHRGRHSRVLDLKPNATHLRVTLGPAFTDTSATLDHVDIRLIERHEPTPLFAAGVMYTRTTDITRCAREILDHAGHYRATAVELAKNWSMFHNPAHLVREMGVVEGHAVDMIDPMSGRLRGDAEQLAADVVGPGAVAESQAAAPEPAKGGVP